MAESETRTSRFYDGQTARPRDVEIAFQERILVLLAREDMTPIARWPIAEMSAIDRNEMNGEMTFRCRGEPEARLILSPSPQRDQMLQAAAHLKHWKRRERTAVAKTIGGLALAGLAVVLGCYFGLPRLAIAAVQLMPLQWDAKLGDPVRERIVEHEQICANEAAQAVLDRLGERLMPENIRAVPLTLDVVETKDINAFALPGNHIIIYSGLIAKADTPEILAGVLAHEMGHLEMRHPTRGLIEQLGLGVAINLVLGNNAFGNIGRVMAGLSYTRDMERQADERAVALLHRAHIRADGLAAFFDLLKKDERLHIPVLLSDHPGLEERAAATKQDSSGEPAMSAGDWQTLKSICRNG
ncbi:MAG TPA: M48 family metallopeptidase [Dongiaceae bacterium]|nr:M48 family metallopeptidase [Dongiaceae bacterium]